jgi:hypothetical protein
LDTAATAVATAAATAADLAAALVADLTAVMAADLAVVITTVTTIITTITAGRHPQHLPNQTKPDFFNIIIILHLQMLHRLFLMNTQSIKWTL